MKLGRLNHVGVATPSIDASVTLYRDTMGAEPHGPAQGVTIAKIDQDNAEPPAFGVPGRDSRHIAIRAGD